jgi:glycosyltransferase 2 family protein
MIRILKDFRRWLPGTLISLVVIVILAFAVDWNAVVVAFATMDLRFLALHGLFYFGSVGTRALAARALLENRPSVRDSFVVMMQGYLLNNVLPLRMGELGRAYLLGRKTGLGMFHALPAIVIERFYDLAFAALVLMSTLPFVLSGIDWARPVAFTTLGVVTLGLLSLHLVARFREPLKAWVDRVAGRVKLVEKYVLPQIDSFLDGLAVLTNMRSFVLSLLWMALSWGFGVLYQWALLLGFIPAAPLLYSTFAFGASSFAGAIPSAPASLGVYEGAVVAVLKVVGISSGIALAYAVTHHVMHLVYSGIIGFYGFSRDGIGLMDMYERLLGNREQKVENTNP